MFLLPFLFVFPQRFPLPFCLPKSLLLALCSMPVLFFFPPFFPPSLSHLSGFFLSWYLPNQILKFQQGLKSASRCTAWHEPQDLWGLPRHDGQEQRMEHGCLSVIWVHSVFAPIRGNGPHADGGYCRMTVAEDFISPSQKSSRMNFCIPHNLTRHMCMHSHI